VADRDGVAERIRDSVAELERLLEGDHLTDIAKAAEIMLSCFRSGGKLVLFGNGGSAADATHIAAEFLGRYMLEREPFPALSLSDNASSLTAIANDYAFADVFARQLRGLGRPGDVALAISTSGESENVIAGVEAAGQLGMHTIGLTGGTGGRLRQVTDCCIVVPAGTTPRIQEAHVLVAHVMCEMVERELAGSLAGP
jgi:D-sedoheptulose 7-phosphate isomerase